VFVSLKDENLGAVHKIDLNGSNHKQLTTEKGIYRMPAFDPKNQKIVYKKEGGNEDQGFDFSKNTGIYLMNVDGSMAKKIADGGDFPMFNTKGDRIFVQTGGSFMGGLTKTLISFDLEGQKKQSHFSFKLANRLVPSPDNHWISFIHLHKLYVAPFVHNGSTINLDTNSSSFKVESLSENAGINLHWSNNSSQVHWTFVD